MRARLRTARPRLARAIAALALAVAATGCADSAALPPPAAHLGAAPQDAAPAAASARVGLIDFEVVHRPAEVLSGLVVLRATNTGATVHDLVVRGQAGQWRTPHLRPGEQAELVVTAHPGEVLDLWCSVAGHDAAGMRSTLSVLTPSEPTPEPG